MRRRERPVAILAAALALAAAFGSAVRAADPPPAGAEAAAPAKPADASSAPHDKPAETSWYTPAHFGSGVRYTDLTPRGALYGFFTAASRADFAAASTYLDLSNLSPEERAERGPVLARHLKAVLDRALWIDLDEVSDRPEGSASDSSDPNVEHLGSIQSSAGPVPIRMRRQQDARGDLVWRFSAGLTGRIEPLFAEFGDGWIGEHVPDRLHRMRFLGVEAWQWLGIVLLATLSVLIGWGTATLVRRIAEPVSRRTVTLVDDRLVQVMHRPTRLVVGLIVFALGVRLLHLTIRASAWMDRVLIAFAFFSAIAVVGAIVDAFTYGAKARFEREGQAAGAGVVNIIGRVVKVVLASIAIIGVMQALGFNVTGLLAGLGIGGIALALAAQKTVENLLGGLTLMADRPVKIGDFCKFGTTSGYVEDFGFRSTRVRTLERSIVSVPNSEMANVQIENLSVRDRIRLTTTFGLRYETTPDQLRDILIAIRRLFIGHPKVASDPLRIRFVGFGTSTLDVEILAYVMTSSVDEFYAVREDLLFRVMEVVTSSGSGFAFPSQTLYMAQDTALDSEERAASEDRTRRLREQGKLPFPDFTPDETSSIADTLDYPPQGSSSSPPPVTPS